MKKRLLAIVSAIVISVSSVQPVGQTTWSDWAAEGMKKAQEDASKIWEKAKADFSKAAANVARKFEEIKTKYFPKTTESFDEKESKYVLTVELPGYDAKDIEVEIAEEKIIKITVPEKDFDKTVVESTVIIETQDDKKSEEKKLEVKDQKRVYEFTIPENFIIGKVRDTTSSYKNGVLKIRIPATKKISKEKKEKVVTIPVK